MIFCDTSTLAKYYIPEKESLKVQPCLEKEDQVALSELARIELMAVFHRRLRENKWNQKEFTMVIQQFTRDDADGYWKWLPLDEPILKQGTKIFTTLSKEIFLRSSDCLHLITATHYQFSEIYTYDRHQSQAASAFGMIPISIS